MSTANHIVENKWLGGSHRDLDLLVGHHRLLNTDMAQVALRKAMVPHMGAAAGGAGRTEKEGDPQQREVVVAGRKEEVEAVDR
jgi:hypothetical protein